MTITPSHAAVEEILFIRHVFYFTLKIMAATEHKGVDVIIEMLANANLGKDLGLLARGGVVAVVGSRGTVEINPRDLMQREAAVIGVMGAFQHVSTGFGIT